MAFEGGAYDIVTRQQVGIAVWWGLAVAVAFGVLPIARTTRATRTILFAMACFAGITALSLVSTESSARTFDEFCRTMIYLGFGVAWVLSINRHNWRWAAGGISAALLFVTAAAFASRVAPDLIGQRVAVEGRLAYPFGYWNALAAWAGMTTAVAVSLSVSSMPWLRRLALASVPLSLAVVYLTLSRAGAIATAAGVVIAVILAKPKLTAAVHAGVGLVTGVGVIAVLREHPTLATGMDSNGAAAVVVGVAVAAAACWWVAGVSLRRHLDDRRVALSASGKRLVTAALLAAAFGTAVFGPGLASDAASSFTEAGYEDSQAVDSASAARLVTLSGARDELWASSLSAAGEAPILGVGAGTFEFWWNREGRSGDFVRDPHSLYLGVLGEQGLLGFLGIAAVLLALALGAKRGLDLAVRSDARAAIGGLIAAGTLFLLHSSVDWLWSNTALAVAGLGGLIVAAASVQGGRRRSRQFTPSVAAGVLACVVAGAILVPGVVAEQRLRAAAVEVTRGDFERALPLIEDAQEAVPFAASPHAAQASILSALGRSNEAVSEVDRAIELEGTNWCHRLLKAQIAARAGDTDLVAESLDLAEEFRPQSGVAIAGARATLLAQATLIQGGQTVPALDLPPSLCA